MLWPVSETFKKKIKNGSDRVSDPVRYPIRCEKTAPDRLRLDPVRKCKNDRSGAKSDIRGIPIQDHLQPKSKGGRVELKKAIWNNLLDGISLSCSLASLASVKNE